MNVHVKLVDGMTFAAEVNGHTVLLDADESVGGADKGPRPKALMLGSLGGCTGMDVVSLLKKMRVDIDGFEMKIDGEVGSEHPKVYTSIHVTYIFYGKDLPMEKLEKIVSLSQEKYCGVSAMLKTSATLTYSIEVKASS